MTVSSGPMTDCPNCGARLDGSFCGQCGQKSAPLNPSFHDFLHDLAHEILHVDGKIVRSARLLVTSPGFLSREHFEGRRARYVSPIRLYLIFSVMYFAIAAFAPSTAFRVNITLRPGDPPGELERLEELQKKGNEALAHWTPRVMFVLVPLFAVLVAPVARKSGRNYPLHLYFALHVHAAWFFAAALAAAGRIRTIPVVTTAIPAFAAIYGAIYLVLAFRRAYDVTTAHAVMRTVVVVFVYWIFVLAALIVIVFPFGVFDR